MSVSAWDDEAKRLPGLTTAEQQAWLTNLLFDLTVMARDTYEIGGHDLVDPRRMRRFNELMHQTVNQLRATVSGRPGMPLDTFARAVGEELAQLGFAGLPYSLRNR